MPNGQPFAGLLRALCRACGIGFGEAVPAWPAGSGRRSGANRSEVEAGRDELPDALKRIAEAARPLYESLARHKLKPLAA
jgi:hypothetical protein